VHLDPTPRRADPPSLPFLGVVCVRYGFDKVLHVESRQSIIVLCMGAIIAGSAVLLTLQSLVDADHRVQVGEGVHVYVSRGSPCVCQQRGSMCMPSEGGACGGQVEGGAR